MITLTHLYLIRKYEDIADGEDCRDQEGILLNAYAAYRVVELRHNVYELYEKQFNDGGRKSASLYDKAKKQGVEAKPYLSLLNTRFKSERDEEGRNFKRMADGL